MDILPEQRHQAQASRQARADVFNVRPSFFHFQLERSNINIRPMKLFRQIVILKLDYIQLY